MHLLSGALPLPYVPARVTRAALVAHINWFAPSRCRTSQYSRTFVPLSVSLWNDLSDPAFNGAGLAGFCSFFFTSYCFIFFFLLWVGCVGLGSLY